MPREARAADSPPQKVFTTYVMSCNSMTWSISTVRVSRISLPSQAGSQAIPPPAKVPGLSTIPLTWW
jgi:hypothetical protein